MLIKESSITEMYKTAKNLFGNMRQATREEKKSVDDYIKSISKSTGVDFFDIC